MRLKRIYYHLIKISLRLTLEWQCFKTSSWIPISISSLSNLINSFWKTPVFYIYLRIGVDYQTIRTGVETAQIDSILVLKKIGSGIRVTKWSLE